MTPPKELSSEAYRLWLYAQRPPLAWFVRLPRSQQKELAKAGEDYVVEVLTALVDELRGGAPSEEDQLRQASKAFAESLKNGKGKPAGGAKALDAIFGVLGEARSQG